MNKMIRLPKGSVEVIVKVRTSEDTFNVLNYKMDSIEICPEKDWIPACFTIYKQHSWDFENDECKGCIYKELCKL